MKAILVSHRCFAVFTATFWFHYLLIKVLLLYSACSSHPPPPIWSRLTELAVVTNVNRSKKVTMTAIIAVVKQECYINCT